MTTITNIFDAPLAYLAAKCRTLARTDRRGTGEQVGLVIVDGFDFDLLANALHVLAAMAAAGDLAGHGGFEAAKEEKKEAA